MKKRLNKNLQTQHIQTNTCVNTQENDRTKKQTGEAKGGKEWHKHQKLTNKHTN